MRISDWSSDVCSSDLLRLGLEAPVGARIILRVEVADGHVDPEPAVLAARFQQRHRHLGIGRQPVGETAARGAGADDHVVERAGRSEEHTSELQSLMRISYAVFCLKKKKKQQNTNQVTN